MLYSGYANKNVTPDQKNNSNGDKKLKWDAISEICNLKDYDIICLQECDNYQQFIDDNYDYKEAYIKETDFNTNKDCILTIYNKNKFNFINIKTTFIFKTDKTPYKRHPVMTVFLEHIDTKKIIGITNVHVPGGPNNNNDSNYNNIDQSQINNFGNKMYKDFVKNKGYKDIIDLNNVNNDIYIRCGDHNRDFFNNNTILVNNLTYNTKVIVTEPSKNRQIDYILSNYKNIDYPNINIETDKLEKYTDHLPITATITL